MRHQYTLHLIAFACGSIWASGCGEAGKNSQERITYTNEIAILRTLPVGWRLMPKSEMPPIDKTPWWVDNPLLLDGKAATKVDVAGRPTRAISVVAAMYEYEKDYVRIPVLVLTYANADDASAEYSVLKKDLSFEQFVGVGRSANSIVMMTIPTRCPDRGFFLKHFEAISRREQATQFGPQLNGISARGALGS